MKKYYKKISRPGKGYVFLGIGVLLLLFSFFSLMDTELYGYFFKSRDLSEVYAEEIIDNSYYSAYSNFLLGSYAYDEYGSYYAMPIEDLTQSGDYSGYTYMGFYVYEDDVELADKIMELTWEYLDGGEDELWIGGRGYVVEMDPSEQDFFKEWFFENGADEEQIEKLCYKTFYLTPLYVMLLIDEGRFFLWLLAGLASLVLILIGLYQLLFGYKKQVVKYMKRNDLDPEKLSYELDGGVQFKTAVVSSRLVMGYKPQGMLIKLSDLVWVYDSVMRKTKNQAYYGNGGSTMSYVNRIVFVDRNKKKRILELSGADEGERMMETLKTKAPFLIYGYSGEIEQTMKQDFSRLIRQVDENRSNNML